MRACRILLSTKCNLKCQYCCNNLPEIQEQFKMKTLVTLFKTPYDVYNISGGEPFLDYDYLLNICKEIKKANSHCKVYIYTNGTKSIDMTLHDELYKYIDGFNIGVHDSNYDQALMSFFKFNIVTSVRLHIQENYKNRLTPMQTKLINEIKETNKLKIWKMNECNVENEDRFII